MRVWSPLRLLGLPLWASSNLYQAWQTRKKPLLELKIGPRSPEVSLRALALAGRDPDILGLWLKVESAGELIGSGLGGLCGLLEVHRLLLEARAQGKVVLVELEQAGNAEVLLASAASFSWVRPANELYCTGLAMSMVFFGQLLQRFQVKLELEAVGAYKSAGEMFTRSMATPESREAMQSIVGSLHTDFVEAIARGRGIEKTVVEEALEKAPLSPETAVAMGLITGVGWEDEVAAEVNKRFDEPDILEFSRWARVALRKSALESWGAASPTIAVVVLKGAIVDGSGTPGAATLPALPACEALDALVEESVAGVVLAIDSPGGSAVASDRIWRSVVRLARTKPVVAWMGSVAASGGYYIAAGATEIVALPTTITGSIGVVGGKLSLGEALSQQGVHVEHIAATSQATMMSAIYRFSQGQRNSFRASLERVYQTFLERVSAGRRRPVRDILPYAGGRVWTGRQAIERGLVDRLGGLQGSPSAAVERAASLAGISEWRTIEVIPSIPEGWLLGRLRRLIRGLVQSEARALIGTELPSDPVLTGLLQLKSGAWALWPYMLLWR